jgi:microcystin-dependent protein
MTAGIVIPFAGTTAPQGWMLCDGSAVSRTTYAALFAVIGTTYGEGDGETTFNIPDLSGRVVIGSSQSHALGTTGGSETVTLTADQLPAHTHVVPQHGHGNNIEAAMPALSHEITSQPAYKYNKPNISQWVAAVTGTLCRGTSNATATRSIDVSIAEHEETACTTDGSITAKEAFDSGSFGGGAGHNNMQPYVAVNYVICMGE